MQIFEVTYTSKKTITEINFGQALAKGATAMKSLPAAGAAVGKALGTIATAKAGQYVQQKTGISPGGVEANPYGDQESQAAQAAKPVIAQQSKEQQKLWNTAINKMQQAQNVVTPMQLNSSSKAELGRSLNTQLHRNLLQNKLGSDYRQLSRFVDNDPDTQTKAKQIIDDIDTALQGISGALVKYKSADQSKLDWDLLANAAYEAMSLVQFRPGRGQAPTAAKSAAGQQNPVQAAQTNLIQTSGVTPSMLAQIQAIVGQLPATRSNDPTTQAYLQALGFKP